MFIQAAENQTKQYYTKKHSFGYSVKDELPKNAKQWIEVCLQTIRAKIKKCLIRPTDISCIRLGKPGLTNTHTHTHTRDRSHMHSLIHTGTPVPVKSAYKRIVSPNLGEYPYEYVDLNIDRRVTTL